jgi:hypothetical protein
MHGSEVWTLIKRKQQQRETTGMKFVRNVAGCRVKDETRN